MNHSLITPCNRDKPFVEDAGWLLVSTPAADWPVIAYKPVTYFLNTSEPSVFYRLTTPKYRVKKDGRREMRLWQNFFFQSSSVQETPLSTGQRHFGAVYEMVRGFFLVFFVMSVINFAVLWVSLACDLIPVLISGPCWRGSLLSPTALTRHFTLTTVRGLHW